MFVINNTQRRDAAQENLQDVKIVTLFLDKQPYVFHSGKILYISKIKMRNYKNK